MNSVLGTKKFCRKHTNEHLGDYHWKMRNAIWSGSFAQTLVKFSLIGGVPPHFLMPKIVPPTKENLIRICANDPPNSISLGR